MTVKIKSRYNDDVEFKEIASNTYLFSSSSPYGWGFTMNADKSIYSVDPPGGPFVYIGYIIPKINKEVVEITTKNKEGVILKTK